MILPRHLRLKQGGFLLNPYRFGGYPTIAATNTGTDSSSNATSATISLPTGIVSGNMLLIHVTFGTAVTSRAITGWTEFSSSSLRSSVFYRIADGTEGSTVNITWTTSTTFRARSVRITGSHASAAPEYDLTLSSLDGGSLSPSWGGAGLYVVFAYRPSTIDGYPSNAPDNHAIQSVGTTFSTGIASATSGGSSFDPGAFGTDSGTARNIYTVAVRPA